MLYEVTRRNYYSSWAQNTILSVSLTGIFNGSCCFCLFFSSDAIPTALRCGRVLNRIASMQCRRRSHGVVSNGVWKYIIILLIHMIESTWSHLRRLRDVLRQKRDLDDAGGGTRDFFFFYIYIYYYGV